MENVIRKYGVVVLFYITVIAGVLMLNARLRYISKVDNTNSENKIIAMNNN